jgi:hypothetical protein
MRKHALTRVFLAGALCAMGILSGLAGAAIAQEKKPDTIPALLGTWDAQTEDGGRSLVFKFTLENGELKGVYTGQAGETKMEGLKVEGNKVTFVVKIGGDQGMVIDFTAFFGGDEMNGTLSLQFGEAAFSGKKRK